MSVIDFIKEFYGSFGSQAAKAYSRDPDRYETKILPGGLLAYEVVNFDSINLKLLAGDKQTLRDLICPLKKCNLFIRVPSSLSDYISDLLAVGFKIECGQDLLLMARYGDTND